MHHVVRTLALVVLTGLAAQTVEQARESITAAEIGAHIFLLAGDDYEGRAPGTPGADRAARYIQSRFMALGLEPVHDSYTQSVPLLGTTPDPVRASLAFEANGDRLRARYGSDAVFWPGDAEPSLSASGELVFVGHGVDAPEWRWDDFGNRDLEGKVLLVLVGDPPAPPDEPDLFDGRALTLYGRWTYKIEEAQRRGAAGVLLIHRAPSAGYGWDVVVSSWTGEQLGLEREDDAPPVPLQGWLTAGFTRQLLGRAGLDFDELVARAARRDFRPVATGITARARVSSRTRRIAARNVVGFIPGRDPERRNEVVIFTAHYDHLGVGPASDGDSIYNGAYDNASGVALLLELADAFGRLGGTDRSLLFLATTGEEAGLLGAERYARRPLFPLHRTAAVINIDGANLWGETDDVIAPGVDRSTLGTVLRARAREMGMEVRPDPVPERGAFFRSDHFPLARAGVPALFVQHGLRFRGHPTGWGDAMMREWQTRHYHSPSDEFDPHMDLSGAVQQGRLIFSLGYDVANADSMPVWVRPGPFMDARNPGLR